MKLLTIYVIYSYRGNVKEMMQLLSMLKKRITVIILIAFCFLAYQPAPAHAGFFLFNMFNSVFHTSKMPIVKYGMRGKEVVTVQNYLIKYGYLSGNPDGVFGNQTLRAVKEFQRAGKLGADGVVGEKTFDALKKYKGTKPKSQSSVAKKPKAESGVPAYRQSVAMVATAYTRYDEGCGDYTYRGTYLRHGLVAVDPDFIPLGTRLYIPGYGHAVADDIGGAIQGNRIDLAMETLNEAYDFGIRNVTVYVL